MFKQNESPYITKANFGNCSLVKRISPKPGLKFKKKKNTGLLRTLLEKTVFIDLQGGRRRAKRSYSTFKVRRGVCEEIPLIQGKEQQLRFAGVGMKRYPHIQGKTAGVVRGHQRADTLKS